MKRRRPTAEGPRTDSGSGLVEILVAVVLLGIGATGTLTAIAAAIKGSVNHEQLTGGRRWVVSAGDELVSSNVTRIECTSGEAAVRAAYQSAAQAVTNGRPAGWSAAQLTVQSPVLFWDGTTFGTTCYEANGLELQQITLVAASPDGEVDETLTVVKKDG